MRQISFIELLLWTYCLLGYNCNNSSLARTSIITQEFVITEGVGFATYKIDSTSIKEIKRDFGRNYKLKYYKGYGTEVIYEKVGLAFFYDTNDTLQRITSISFFHPFKAITTKGIILNKSTMLDVQNIYKLLDWYTTDESNYWTSTHAGIEFSVDREMSLPQYPLDEELHTKKAITRIEVVNAD